VTQARGRETDRRIPGVGAPVENGLRGVVFLSGPNRVELAHEAFLSFLFYFLFSLSQFKLQLEFKFDFCDKLVSNLNIPLEYDMR
jgi:hypothetical protein